MWSLVFPFWAHFHLINVLVALCVAQIDEDTSLVPEAIQGGTYGFNSANVPAEGFQF